MRNLFTLNPLLIKYKWRLLLGVLLMVVANWLAVYSVDFVGSATNTISKIFANKGTQTLATKQLLRQELLWASLVIIGLAILSSLLKFGMRQMIIVASRKMEFDLKNQIYQHYQFLDLNFYKKNKTGDLINRITEDVTQVRMYLGPGLMYPINLASLIIILFVVMIQQDVPLTLYTLAPLPVLSFLIYKVAFIINKKSKEVQEQQSELSSFVQDTFSGIRVIKSFSIGNKIQESYQTESEKYEDKALSLAKTQAFFFPLMILIVGISYALILYIGGLRYINGQITEIGVLAQFFIYLNMLIWPFTSLGWVTMVVQRAEASMKRINEFLNSQPTVINTNKDKIKIKGSIAFKNVSFVYENTQIKALDNVSFTVKAGETVAILGRTGSGKTTIVNLLARLFDASSGEILIDNINIKQHNLYHLRQHIGFVPQEAFLFSDTIQNNILFGVDDSQEPTAIKYAKKAAVHNNIVNFNQSYQTKIGERGVTLSGGQKQRLSIARALVKNPPILVFDDSLSAVDTETEEQILNNLESETQNKTTIIITHRVSSAKNANQIIILEGGKIIEQGTHKQLMDLQQNYFDLYQKQLQTEPQ